jgi:hypothetical protein
MMMAPALDKQFRKLIKGMKVGEGSALIAQAWLDGFSLAQIKDAAHDLYAVGK